jgi:hypothetical protein
VGAVEHEPSRSRPSSLRRRDFIPFPGPRNFSRALLLFWAIWFSVVSTSNAADALRETGLLPASWRFASGNFALVAGSISLYSLSRTWASVLFSLVLLLQLATSALFWRATLETNPLSPRASPRILHPFFAGTGLFCAFLVSDEVFLVYRRFPDLETTHFSILCAQLLSLLLIRLLAEREQAP